MAYAVPNLKARQSRQRFERARLGNVAGVSKRWCYSVLLMSALLLPSCGGSDEAETTENPGEISFELSERGDAGVVGVRATLRFETPERTTIIVDGLDEGEPAGGGPNPVRLVRGSCDDPLSVVAELESLQGPVSTTTVDLGLTTLLNGDYAVEVRLTKGQAEVVIACGDVPDDLPKETSA